MLFSYIAHISGEKNINNAVVYSLPVRYSLDIKGLDNRTAIENTLMGVSIELDSYLRATLRKKQLPAMPYRQPLIIGDYDIPVQLDVAFIMILKVYRACFSQKELASRLNKSSAYLSSIENFETGVSLANASEMLTKLGIRAGFNIIPYRDDEIVHFQYSPDKTRIPVIPPPYESNQKIDSYIHASYTQYQKNQINLPFPASMRKLNAPKGEIIEVSFPCLDKYGLNVSIVEHTEDEAINRATYALNLALLNTDKKIPYIKPKAHDVKIYLWIETAKKLFSKELKNMNKSPGLNGFN